MVRADGQENRPETLCPQVFQQEIPAQHLIALQFHAQLEDLVDFKLHDFAGKPVFGDPQREHSPGHRRGFEQGDRVPQPGQVVRTSQSGRARADHGDRFLPLGQLRQTGRMAKPHVVRIGGGAFQGPDGNGLVDLTAAARLLAGMAHTRPQT